MKKSKNIKLLIFSIFPKTRDFAGFAMRKWRYLGGEFTNFDYKTRFGKYIRFH